MPYTKIFCNHIDSPIWQDGTFNRREKQVDIWKIDLRNSNPFPEDILNKDELVKASRFVRVKDRESFISRRTALRILLSRYTEIPPSKIEFIAGKNKKPERKSESNNIRFNVSHSGELILIAISSTEVGIDIERIESNFNYFDILKHSFNKREISQIEHAANSLELFFRFWTRKEALSKASAKGLDDDLKDIPCLDGWHSLDENLIGLIGDWQLKSFQINTEYTGSIVCKADKTLNFLNFEF